MVKISNFIHQKSLLIHGPVTDAKHVNKELERDNPRVKTVLTLEDSCMTSFVGVLSEATVAFAVVEHIDIQ